MENDFRHRQQSKLHCRKCGRRSRKHATNTRVISDRCHSDPFQRKRQQCIFPTEYPLYPILTQMNDNHSRSLRISNDANVIIDQLIEVQQLSTANCETRRHRSMNRQPECRKFMDTSPPDRFQRVQQMIYLRENINNSNYREIHSSNEYVILKRLEETNHQNRFQVGQYFRPLKLQYQTISTLFQNIPVTSFTYSKEDSSIVPTPLKQYTLAENHSALPSDSTDSLIVIKPYQKYRHQNYSRNAVQSISDIEHSTRIEKQNFTFETAVIVDVRKCPQITAHHPPIQLYWNHIEPTWSTSLFKHNQSICFDQQLKTTSLPWSQNSNYISPQQISQITCQSPGSLLRNHLSDNSSANNGTLSAINTNRQKNNRSVKYAETLHRLKHLLRKSLPSLCASNEIDQSISETMTPDSLVKTYSVTSTAPELQKNQSTLSVENEVSRFEVDSLNRNYYSNQTKLRNSAKNINCNQQISDDDETKQSTSLQSRRVRNPFEFIRQLKSSAKDPAVKCVSIIGNTGDGKSYTLNQVFFNGQEKFNTSSKSDSCTVGAWAELDESQRTLVVDTEGRLGLSQNDNTRDRLLLKIMCVSDVVIYRTKAPRLSNDMFQFLSDASTAFLQYFKKESENVMRSCKVERSMSAMGPTLIVFHETEHTEVLRDFSEIKATVNALLENNKIRSTRRLSIIFKVLKALNEKFNHAIPPDMPSTLPDDFFTCFVRCLSCGSKCHETANHQKDGIPHQCHEQCSYNKELDNEIMKCVQCDREGNSTIVYGKLVTTNDHLVGGFLKYVWSDSMIECPKHDEIYRSRKYWHGNNGPKDVTPRKFMEMVVYAGSYLHKCFKCSLEFGSDFSKHHCRACGQVFCDTCTIHRRVVPWIDIEKTVRVCKACHDNPRSCPPPSISTSLSSTVSERDIQSIHKSKRSGHEIGSSDNSASAVSSGEHFSDLCLTPSDILDIDQSGAGPITVEIPTSRWAYEAFVSGLENIGANYPIALIKESTRPTYWRPDNECRACSLCKREFNSITNRLHYCRNCGDSVCENCSPMKRCVPERDWLTPVRVCKSCDQAMNESNQ